MHTHTQKKNLYSKYRLHKIDDVMTKQPSVFGNVTVHIFVFVFFLFMWLRGFTFSFVLWFWVLGAKQQKTSKSFVKGTFC